MRFQALLLDPYWSHVLQCLLKFPLILFYFLQDASNTQTALGSAISGSLFGLFLEQCSSNSTLSFCCVVLLPARRFRNSAMAINTPPSDHLQGPPEPAKTQRKPQRPTPALPLGRHRRSHIDTVFSHGPWSYGVSWGLLGGFKGLRILCFLEWNLASR